MLGQDTLGTRLLFEAISSGSGYEGAADHMVTLGRAAGLGGRSEGDCIAGFLGFQRGLLLL